MHDESRSGAPRIIEDARIKKVIVTTLESQPDNATPKTKTIRDWLAKRPRLHVHLTPTGSSWLNQVKRFFTLSTSRQIRREVHRSVGELEAAINTFLDKHNENLKAFKRIESADDILAAVERYWVRTVQTAAQ